MKKNIAFFVSSLLLLVTLQVCGQEYLEMIQGKQGANFYDIQDKFYEYYINYDLAANKEEEGMYYQFKRWEWFIEPRVYPSGNLINTSAAAFNEFLKMQNTDLRSTNGHWTSLGPDSYTVGSGWNGGIGRINCIAFHPTDEDIVWVGTPAGGLWKTTNNGGTWISLTDGIPVIGVSGIAVDPNNTDIIYILTGDGDGSDTRSIGVLKTTNGGLTWQTTGLSWGIEDNVGGYKLAMHPTNSSILFAVTSTGIFKTANGGFDWDEVESGIFFDLEFKPGDPSVMYAVKSSLFFKSIDTGNTWTSSSATGLPSIPLSTRMAVAVTEDIESIVYVAYAGPLGFIGLYRSQDSGSDFDFQSSFPNVMGRDIDGLDFGVQQSNYDFVLASSPNDASVVYIGGINVWKSNNFGESWYIITHWYEKDNTIGYNHADQHALEFNPNNERIYTGTDGGIYYSEDFGSTWNDISSGLQHTQIYRMADYNADADLFLIGAQDNGINIFDNGASMNHARGADGMECVLNYLDPQVAYASTQNGTLYKSVLGYAFWDDISPDDSGAWITPFIMDPTDDDILYIGYDDIYKTTDGGNSWSTKLTGSTDYIAMAMGTSNPNRIYACTPSAVRTSSNGGSTWNTVTGTLPVASSQISNIAVSTVNAKKAWITFSGFVAGVKVFETSNSGTSWTNISGSLPNLPVNCVTYCPGTNDGIYVGTDLGVYYRDDDLGDWIPFMNGLPHVIVNDLEVNVDANVIRAATFGRGIWSSDLYSACPDNYILTEANNVGSGCTQDFTASNSITSSRKYLGGVGCDIKYNAGELIVLADGFEVTEGGKLYAYIEGCNGLMSPIKYSGIYDGTMVMNAQTQIEQGSLSAFRDLEETELSIYPNPTNKQLNICFYIDTDSYFSIDLLDMAGKKIETIVGHTLLKKGGRQLTKDISHIPEGSYLIHVVINSLHTVKLISKID